MGIWKILWCHPRENFDSYRTIGTLSGYWPDDIGNAALQSVAISILFLIAETSSLILGYRTRGYTTAERPDLRREGWPVQRKCHRLWLFYPMRHRR